MASQKTIIYVITIVSIVFLSLLLLLFYYTQDVERTFIFKQSIPFGEIRFEKSSPNNYESVSYLTSATAPIGTLQISNHGSFPLIYKFPFLVGCIEPTETAVSSNSAILNSPPIQISFDANGREYYSSLRTDTTFTIGIGNSQNFSINGKYYPNNNPVNGYYSGTQIPFSEFNKGNIKSISIYELNQKLENPLSDSSYDTNSKYTCAYMKANLKPFASISIG